MKRLAIDRPLIVGVGGFTSNVGKTTLMCNLLRMLPGWEAIKTTKGHYRSCGKDPHACCVSHLLTNEPRVFSGRSETYTEGKDTGRYWDAGAANVHWVIATEAQVEAGIRLALDGVKSPGVLVEGNSFSEYVPVDFFIMVLGEPGHPVKCSARSTLGRTSALFDGWRDARDQSVVNTATNISPELNRLPVYTANDLTKMGSDILQLNKRRTPFEFTDAVSLTDPTRLFEV